MSKTFWKRLLKSKDSDILPLSPSVINQAICDLWVTVEVHDISRVCPRMNCFAQNGTGTGLFPSTYFFACKNLSTTVSYLYFIRLR